MPEIKTFLQTSAIVFLWGVITSIWFSGCTYQAEGPYTVYVDTAGQEENALAAAEIWNVAAKQTIVRVVHTDEKRANRPCDTASLELVPVVDPNNPAHIGYTDHDVCNRRHIVISSQLDDETIVFTMAHEIGHAMGLSHDNGADSLMRENKPKHPVVTRYLLTQLAELGRIPNPVQDDVEDHI